MKVPGGAANTGELKAVKDELTSVIPKNITNTWDSLLSFTMFETTNSRRF